MKWWLIPDEAVKEVRKALITANVKAGSNLYQEYKDALHSLESGLHTTEVVPSDYAMAGKEVAP